MESDANGVGAAARQPTPPARVAGDVPGKLMLAGEYAVLHDGHAVAAAVGRLVRWQLTTPAASDHSDPGTVTLHAFDRTVVWGSDEPAPAGLGHFVAAALDAGAAAGLPLHAALELTVRTGPAGQKLGLGSSAAVVVATLRALAAGAGRTFDAALLRLADDAHRAAQAGKGSGYDVFAIGGGGLGLYDRAARTWTPLAWPAGLFGVALFSGAGADTRDAIGGQVRPTEGELAAIAAGADALTRALRAGDGGATLDALAACEAAFQAMATRQPWLSTPGLRAISTLAASHGGVARTSGAGGGDSAVCVFPSAALRDAAQAAWAEVGGVAVARLGEDLSPTAPAAAAHAAGSKDRR